MTGGVIFRRHCRQVVTQGAVLLTCLQSNCVSASLSTLCSTNYHWSSKVELKFKVDGSESEMEISKEVAMRIQATFQTETFSVELLLRCFRHMCVSASMSTDPGPDNQSWVELVFKVDGKLSTSKMEISKEAANRIAQNFELGKFNLYSVIP